MFTLFVVMTGEGWNAVFEEIWTGGTVGKVFSFVLILFFFLAAVLLVEMFTSIIVDNFADAEDSKRQTAQELFHDVVQWYSIWQDMLRGRLRKLNEGMATLTTMRFLHNVSDRPVFYHPGEAWYQMQQQQLGIGPPSAFASLSDGMSMNSDGVAHDGAEAQPDGSAADKVEAVWRRASVVSQNHVAGTGKAAEEGAVSDSVQPSLGESQPLPGAAARLVSSGGESGGTGNHLTLDSDPTALHLARELMLSRARRYSDATVVTINSDLEAHAAEEDEEGEEKSNQNAAPHGHMRDSQQKGDAG